MANNWIQKALAKSKKGSLHKNLGVPMGEKIPEATLEEAASKPGVVGKRARLAETLKGFKKSGPVKSIAEMRSRAKGMV